MKMINYLDKSTWPSLLLFPLANMGLFLFYVSKNSLPFKCDAVALMEQALLLLVVACAEELFFRGLLLREMVFDYFIKPIKAAIAVSFLFGVLHLFNAFSYATLSYAVLQGLCAFAVGVDLAAIYCRFKSVVPCAIVHALINITSIGLDGDAIKLTLTKLEASVFFVVAILYFIHGYKFFKMWNYQADEGEDK